MPCLGEGILDNHTVMTAHSPSFLCIGAQKAGTSWLYAQLRQHPDIWLPPIKELHYFDHLYCEANRSWTTWHIQQAAKSLIQDHFEQCEVANFAYIRYLAAMACKPLFTEQWYRQAFNRPAAKNKMAGDITPEYCAIGDEGIAYVKRLLGNIKIIWIIRDPIERALSQIRMNAERQGITGNISRTQGLELANNPEIFERGNYADYIPRWESQFDPTDMLFLPFRHIGGQPLATLQAIAQFIGIASWDGYAAPHQKVHPSRPFELPDEVSAYLNERLQTQYTFLHDRFDADFINAI